MHVLRYSSDRIDNQQRERLEEHSKRFFGETFADRARRYLGRTSDADLPDDGKPERPTFVQVAQQLAEEAFDRPDELRVLVPWLISGQAENVWPFAWHLGRLDTEHTWLETMLEAVRSAPDPRLLSGYLAGRAEAGEREWRESMLDKWSDDRTLAPAVFDGTFRGPPSDRAVNRLLKLIDHGWLGPTYLGWLQLGRWIQGVSTSALADAVVRLERVGTAEAIEGALALIEDWVDVDGRTLAGELADLAWRLLERPSGWGREPMVSFYWERVADRLLQDDPLRIARLIVRMYLEGEPAFRDSRLGLLRQALALSPAEIWETIGEALLAGPRSYRLMWALEETDVVARVPIEVITRWVEMKGQEGARAVAGSLKLQGGPLPEVVRFLLRDYGSLAGGALAAAFVSGSWWGSEAAYLEEKARAARDWQQDREPAVRRWATELTCDLERRAQESRLREEEESLV